LHCYPITLLLNDFIHKGGLEIISASRGSDVRAPRKIAVLAMIVIAHATGFAVHQAWWDGHLCAYRNGEDNGMTDSIVVHVA
jgi:hypothetical protein